MPYITTNHRFIIDDKHPSDVFGEMENFFSLYTIEMTDLQQLSIQLSVPAHFAINDNKKLAESYRQFVQAIRYTVPEASIMPITTRSAAQAEDAIASHDDNTVILLIQRYDGATLEDTADTQPSLYQRTLGKLLPKFGSERSDTGLYPTQAPITITAPTPVAMPTYVPPVAPPAPQPVPAVTPSYQPPVQPVTSPAATPAYHTPEAMPTPAPPLSVVQPAVYQPPAYQAPVSQPSVAASPSIPSNPTAPAVPAQATPVTSRALLTRLTNIAQSIKPYQDILTQAIVAEARRQQAVLSAPITQITLKSSDSLTTAMIEQLFHAFTLAASDKRQVAHDAIDLVSYGYEILKPALAELGMALADDAQFALNSKAHASADDVRRLSAGEVYNNEINLRVKLATATHAPMASSAQSATPSASGTAPYRATPNSTPAQAHPNRNKNPQHIALLLKISDPLGERQQKVNQFPINVVSSDTPSQPHNVRLFGQAGQGLYCAIAELDGQVLLDEIAPGVTVQRQGQMLTQGTVLLPNDTLTISTANNTMTIQLLLAN